MLSASLSEATPLRPPPPPPPPPPLVRASGAGPPRGAAALARAATEVEMVFRTGALASDADVAAAAAAARRLRDFLHSVGTAARAAEAEEETAQPHLKA